MTSFQRRYGFSCKLPSTLEKTRKIASQDPEEEDPEEESEDNDVLEEQEEAHSINFNERSYDNMIKKLECHKFYAVNYNLASPYIGKIVEVKKNYVSYH